MTTNCQPAACSACAQCGPGPLSNFARMSHAGQGFLSQRRKTVLAEGARLFRDGQDSDALYCVSSGVIGQMALHDNGTEVVVDLAYSGDVVGAAAFVRQRSHRTSARALVPSVVCSIPRADVSRLMAESRTLYDGLISGCLSALDDAREAMVRAAALSNEDRLADLLRALAHRLGRVGQDGRLRAELPVSREQMAGMLGVRPETLSRLIKRLQTHSEIVITGREVTLWPDPHHVIPRDHLHLRTNHSGRAA